MTAQIGAGSSGDDEHLMRDFAEIVGHRGSVREDLGQRAHGGVP